MKLVSINLALLRLQVDNWFVTYYIILTAVHQKLADELIIVQFK